MRSAFAFGLESEHYDLTVRSTRGADADGLAHHRPGRPGQRGLRPARAGRQRPPERDLPPAARHLRHRVDRLRDRPRRLAGRGADLRPGRAPARRHPGGAQGAPDAALPLHHGPPRREQRRDHERRLERPAGYAGFTLAGAVDRLYALPATTGPKGSFQSALNWLLAEPGDHPRYLYDLAGAWDDGVPAGTTLDGSDGAVAAVREHYASLGGTAADGYRVSEMWIGWLTARGTAAYGVGPSTRCPARSRTTRARSPAGSGTSTS